MPIYHSIINLFSSHKPAAINSFLQLLFACTSCSHLFQLQHYPHLYGRLQWVLDRMTVKRTCSESPADALAASCFRGNRSQPVKRCSKKKKKAIQTGWADIVHADISINCHVSTWTRFKNLQVNKRNHCHVWQTIVLHPMLSWPLLFCICMFRIECKHTALLHPANYQSSKWIFH